MDLFNVIGRKNTLFQDDINNYRSDLLGLIKNSKVLVVGAAGSIGHAVCLELFNREPALLHAVDISENNLVELVRTIRSSTGYSKCDFKTYAIDCGSSEFESLCCAYAPYDYIFNLSALKHVRSESDPFTLMRMIKVNIFNTVKILKLNKNKDTKNYFCVSTDKAANPVNMMGASKKIMEQFLMRESLTQKISMARFANVAFSDGSLLHGFNQRFLKNQPITAPVDVKRYFITPQESGELCMLSGIMGGNRDIFFPKQGDELRLETFSSIALRYIEARGYEPKICNSEDEARQGVEKLLKEKKWPVYFFESDTTGEKAYEEFYTEKEKLNLSRFDNIGIIENDAIFDSGKLDHFDSEINQFLMRGVWSKRELLDSFSKLLDNFVHTETGKYLDDRM